MAFKIKVNISETIAQNCLNNILTNDEIIDAVSKLHKTYSMITDRLTVLNDAVTLTHAPSGSVINQTVTIMNGDDVIAEISGVIVDSNKKIDFADFDFNGKVAVITYLTDTTL